MSSIIASSVPKEFSVTSKSADVQGQVIEECAQDTSGDLRSPLTTNINFTIDGGGGDGN